MPEWTSPSPNQEVDDQDITILIAQYEQRFDCAVDYDDIEMLIKDFPEDESYWRSEEGAKFYKRVRDMVRENDDMWREDIDGYERELEEAVLKVE